MQRRKNGKSVFLAHLNVRFHSKKIFSHILVWSGDSSSENRISSKLAVISTSSREREREDLFNKRNFHQLYANNGEISRKYQKGTKGTNIEGSSYYMIWTVDFRTRTGSYLTFSLDQQPSSSFTKFMATKSDQDLGKFLVEEIGTEKKNQRSQPKLEGWKVDIKLGSFNTFQWSERG